MCTHTMRREVEIKIITAVVEDGLAAGYLVSVYDGEEIVVRNSADKAAIMAGLFSTDEDMLFFTKDGKRYYVQLIYGNSGWDVIADYSVKLEHIMKQAEEISDHYSQ